MVSSILRFAVAAASLLTLVFAQDGTSKPDPIPTPTSSPVLQPKTDKGCFDSPGVLLDYGPSIYQTSGNCQPICVGLEKPVFAVQGGSNCWCGDLLPPKSSEVDGSKCNKGCNGYGPELCGGVGQIFRVYLSGLTSDDIGYADDEPESTSEAPSSTAPATPDQQTVAVAVTVTNGPTSVPEGAPAEEKKKGPNTVGIAVGVVVGVVALSAIIGGALLFMRRKRRQQAEDDYRRRASLKEFTGKPPGTGHSSLADNRLDPEIMMRRQSDGSIADNQDYSRRILQVRNF